MTGPILCIITVLVVLILVIYNTREKFEFTNESKRYLDIYNYQDFLKTHPEVYPIPYTYTTGLYKLRRSVSEDERTGRECPWIPY